MEPNDLDGAPVAEGEIFTLELLHLADQEGAVAALDDAPRLSAVLNALRAEDVGGDGAPDNTLVLSSGDAYIPGLFFNASADVFGAPGIGDILIQNALGIEAISFGNHEFDFGTEVVKGLIDGSAAEGVLPDFTGTAFPYLSGNLDFSGDENLAGLVVPDGGAPLPGRIAGTVILDVNGEQIGVVGATTPTLPVISSPGGVVPAPADFDTSPTPAQIDALAAEIQADVDALLASNPDLDKLILLAHMQQLSIEQGLAERLGGVDVIVAGGSNTRLLDETDRLRDGDSLQGEYPGVFADADGNPTLVVNTDGSYKYVGRLVIDFDADGNILPDSYDPEVSGAYATDAEGVAALGAEDLVDPTVKEVTDLLREVIIARESNLFGLSTEFLNGERSGAGGPDDLDGVRTQETNLGNLTADANLAIAQAADDTVTVSIKNGGGIRASIGQIVVPAGGTEAERLPTEEIPGVKPAGGISQTDIETALAFNNGLTLLTLTRAELLGVLEHGVSALPEVAGQFPQVAGISFSFDAGLPAGERIVSAAITDAEGAILDVLVEDGALVGDADATVRVVTLNFLADGGDGFPFPDRDRLDLAQEDAAPRSGAADFAPDGTEQDALAEHLIVTYGPETPFDASDTPPTLDERIQNLEFRADSVLGAGPDPDPSITAIFDIQGAAQVSPFVLAASGFATAPQFFRNLPEDALTVSGETVTTAGIVTAVDRNGFFLQDPVGDGNSATSDAILVFTDATPSVAVGDAVEVTGAVAEFFPGGAGTRNLPTTQIADITALSVLSSGNALPEAEIIGQGGRIPPSENIEDDAFIAFNPATSGIDFFESLEAMRVTVEDAVAVAGTSQFGEIYTVANRGADATGLSARGTLNISPGDFNPERVQIDPDADVFDFDFPEVNVGDALGDVTGVVSYAFGNFEVVPTEDFTAAIEPGGLEPAGSDLVGDEASLTLASYNVLNLDLNDADGDADLFDFRFGAIAEQIVNDLNAPDIIALQEIQDDSGSADDGTTTADRTLAFLSRFIDFADDGRINGSLDYQAIDNTFIADGAGGGQPGGNIRTAYLYNADRVSLIEDSVATIGNQQPGGAFEGGRLPLVAGFEFGGEEITVVNNHFSSKGGSAPILGLEQPFEERQEEPGVNGSLDERQAQAAAVAEFVAAALAEDADAKLVVAGDFNEFEFVSPLAGLKAAGLTNLVETLDEDERYSFIFDGNSQQLDHILVSDALAGDAAFDIAHVNTEFAATPFRASDHDPVVARLGIGAPPALVAELDTAASVADMAASDMFLL